MLLLLLVRCVMPLMDIAALVQPERLWCMARIITIKQMKRFVSMAMIETVEAFGNVDAICATEGLTGLYVGPSDLAVSMGHNPGLDRQEEDVDAAIGKILETAKKHGLKAGIHCGSPDYLKSAYERGFDFATIASDIRLIGQAIAMNINAIR